jgi:hypothetical protein
MGNSNSKTSSPTSQIIENDSLFCIEEGRPNEFIFTFYIVMHGAKIATNLSEHEATLFDNCRMFSKTGGTCYSYNNNFNSTQDKLTLLKEQLQKDLKKSSYNIIDKCISKNIKSQYKKAITSLTESELFPSSGFPDTKDDKDFIISNCCKTLIGIKHDKILSVENNDDLGIFLLSVHKKTLDESLSYIPIKYPHSLNLLIISELQKFAKIFEGAVPDLIKTSSKFNEKQTIALWSGIELSSDKKKIKTIRLSKFIEIINSILKNTGKKCNYNLIDDSCSKDLYNPYLKESFGGIDIENKPTEIFGGKNKNKKRKNTNLKQKKNRKNKTKRKY